MANNAKTLVADAKNPNYIITPKLNQYLLDHGNDAVEPAIMERVAAELTKPGRKRSGTFSASASGTCLRAQEFGFLGKPQSPIYPNLQHTFTLGTWVGMQWAATLLQADIIEDIEIPLAWHKYLSMGSADGRGYVSWETVNPAYRGREFIWENKTVGGRVFEKYVAKGIPQPKHIKQVTRYGLVYGADLAVVTYVDKGNMGQNGWHEFVVEITPEMKAESLLELEALKEAADKKQLHPILPGCRIKQGEYKMCPFKDICLQTRSWG